MYACMDVCVNKLIAHSSHMRRCIHTHSMLVVIMISRTPMNPHIQVPVRTFKTTHT